MQRITSKVNNRSNMFYIGTVSGTNTWDIDVFGTFEVDGFVDWAYESILLSPDFKPRLMSYRQAKKYLKKTETADNIFILNFQFEVVAMLQD